MSFRRDWLIGLGIAGTMLILIFFLASIISMRRGYNGVRISGGDKVAVVELLGPIYESRRVAREFKVFDDHTSVKAIVFRIDSPGGGVAASQEIYETVKRVRDGGKPVIVSIGSVAASGGYYAACGGDTIMANPGSTTGSIGVIAEFPNVKALLDRIGIRFETIQSGRYKGSGSPYQEFTEADRRYFQSWVDDAFAQFVDVVAEERNLSHDKVLELADGRVFTGKQAFELGLVDLLGDYDDAVELAAERGGISGEPEVIRITRRRRLTLIDLLLQQVEGLLRGMNGAVLKYAMR